MIYKSIYKEKFLEQITEENISDQVTEKNVSELTEDDLYDDPLTEESAGGAPPKLVPVENVPEDFKKVIQSLIKNVKEACSKTASTNIVDRFFTSELNWVFVVGLVGLGILVGQAAKGIYAHFMNERDVIKQINAVTVRNKYTVVFNTALFDFTEKDAMRKVAADALKKCGFKGGYAGRYVLPRWVGWYYMKGKNNTIYAARFKNNAARIKIQVVCVENTKANEEILKAKNSFRESIENSNVFSDVEFL